MRDEGVGEDLIFKHLFILSLLKCQVQRSKPAALICELRRPRETRQLLTVITRQLCGESQHGTHGVLLTLILLKPVNKLLMFTSRVSVRPASSNHSSVFTMMKSSLYVSAISNSIELMWSGYFPKQSVLYPTGWWVPSVCGDFHQIFKGNDVFN